MTFDGEKDECFQKLRNLVLEADWKGGFESWEAIYGSLPMGIPCALTALQEFSEKSLSERREEAEKAESSVESDEMKKERMKLLRESGVPKFRVTCHRTGDKHPFGSPEVAADMGAEIQRCFGWAVSMKEFNLEVVVNIHGNRVRLRNTKV